MIKKLSVLSLVLVILLSMLTGCTKTLTPFDDVGAMTLEELEKYEMEWYEIGGDEWGRIDPVQLKLSFIAPFEIVKALLEDKFFEDEDGKYNFVITDCVSITFDEFALQLSSPWEGYVKN